VTKSIIINHTCIPICKSYTHAVGYHNCQ